MRPSFNQPHPICPPLFITHDGPRGTEEESAVAPLCLWTGQLAARPLFDMATVIPPDFGHFDYVTLFLGLIN